jgi:hypothetical protein
LHAGLAQQVAFVAQRGQFAAQRGALASSGRRAGVASSRAPSLMRVVRVGGARPSMPDKPLFSSASAVGGRRWRAGQHDAAGLRLHALLRGALQRAIAQPQIVAVFVSPKAVATNDSSSAVRAACMKNRMMSPNYVSVTILLCHDVSEQFQQGDKTT